MKIQIRSIDRITTSLSLAHQRKNKERNKSPAQINPIGTNLKRAETKMKKELNLEAWEKETSNTIKLKKNNEKEEKYYTT